MKIPFFNSPWTVFQMQAHLDIYVAVADTVTFACHVSHATYIFSFSSHLISDRNWAGADILNYLADEFVPYKMSHQIFLVQTDSGQS